MLALSPLFSPVGLQLEEAMIRELQCNGSSTGFSPKQPETPCYDLDGLELPSPAKKKVTHNAYERDRRKKLNDLYSALRSLLPPNGQTKLSIPATISRVLKYIPVLQKQVERLSQRKEELLLSQTRERKRFGLECCSDGAVNPVVSAVCISDMEVMMQLCVSGRAGTGLIDLSRVLTVLEGKGLQIMNASTFSNHENLVFYSLHLQAKEAISMEFRVFCDQLISIVKSHLSLPPDMYA